MGLVHHETATVYYGGGRRWFKLASACRAEARAKARAKYGGSLCKLDYDDFIRAMTAVERLTRLYVRRYRATAPPPNPSPPTRMQDHG